MVILAWFLLAQAQSPSEWLSTQTFAVVAAVGEAGFIALLVTKMFTGNKELTDAFVKNAVATEQQQLATRALADEQRATRAEVQALRMEILELRKKP